MNPDYKLMIKHWYMKTDPPMRVDRRLWRFELARGRPKSKDIACGQTNRNS